MPFKNRYDEMMDLYRDEEPQPLSGLVPTGPRDHKPADDLYPSMAPKNRQKESWELLNTTPDKLTTAQILYPKMLEESLEKKKASQIACLPSPLRERSLISPCDSSRMHIPVSSVSTSNTSLTSNEPSISKPQASAISGVPQTGSVTAAKGMSAKKTDNSAYSRMATTSLDSIESTYRNLVKIGRALGWKHASENLQHYLDASGKEKVMTRDEARELSTLRRAEDENFNQHIQKTLAGDGKGNILRDLKDGETKTFKADWRTARGYSEILRGDPDAVLTHGQTTLKSPGTFFANRQGDTIEVRGIIDQSWTDWYDHHKGKFLAEGALMLEDAGRAKRFPMKAAWSRELVATLRIRPDGSLAPVKLHWQDRDF